MQIKQKELLVLLCCFTLILFPISLVKADETFPPVGTVIVLADDTEPPVITSVTTNENLSSPFDQLAYDSSITTIWYSNVKTFDSKLNITVTANSGLWDLKSFNTSTEWNDGGNVSVSTPEATVQFNYTISNGETSNVNVSLEVYDYSPIKATYNITSTLDNDAPNLFTVNPLFATTYSSCIFINTSVTDSISGINGIGITIGEKTENFTTSGINEFCGLVRGEFKVYAQAYDQVGNLRTATNSGLVVIQADFVEETETIVGDQFDVLTLVEIVLDELYVPIIAILVGVVMIVMLRRAIKT